VPCVTSLDALSRAAAEFTVTDPGLVIDPAALAAARQSLDSTGLLLLGEIHGVRENPLLIRAIMQALGLTSLASGRSGSATAVAVSTTAGRASSPAARTRKTKYGSTSTTANSSWTCPWPRRRLCPTGRSHDHHAQITLNAAVEDVYLKHGSV
jgi:aspartate aminotransferase-like enzyme